MIHARGRFISDSDSVASVYTLDTKGPKPLALPILTLPPTFASSLSLPYSLYRHHARSKGWLTTHFICARRTTTSAV